jgi:hypothetical protein
MRCFTGGIACIIKPVKSGKLVLIVLLSLALLAAGGVPAKAQQTAGYYFPQTGHNIVGEFWTYYQSIPDALLVFGVPITEQYAGPDGLTVQYFEKVRFELHADQPIGRRVVLSDLGELIYRSGAPTVNPTAAGACRVVGGFGICYDFLSYYDDHGGSLVFGNPLSGFEFQPDGRLIQYFERARFEWHPELPEGQKVTLADLGRIYFTDHEDPSRLNAALPMNNIPVQSHMPLSLHAAAFVERAVTLPQDTQRVYVIVQDQALAPVANATGTVTVHLPSGQDLAYPITTDDHGVGVVPAIRFSPQPAGSLVVLDVAVDFQGLSAETTTSFRIWH